MHAPKRRIMSSTIEQSIEIDAPLRTTYNQWTQFEEFPKFMEGVEEVTQLDDTHLRWVAEFGGERHDWTAEITEQKPDERVAWRNTDGKDNAGVVTFHRRASRKSLARRSARTTGRSQETSSGSRTSSSRAEPRPAPGAARWSVRTDSLADGRRMVQGFAELTLQARRPRELERFYCEVFELRRLEDDDDAPDRVWLGAGDGARLGLWTPGEKEFGDEGGAHVHFAFEAQHGALGRIAERASERGVAVEGPVVHDGGDRSLYLEDPEGNVVEAWERGG
jgi:catechol 2,3-dioxygenase-like lactoylglutathione lyase family enzyme